MQSKLRPISYYKTTQHDHCAYCRLSALSVCTARLWWIYACVCVRWGWHTAVLGGQVFSCFCFLGADTGVNIQRMMSQPQQQARRCYKAKFSFHRDLSNIKTACSPTVHDSMSWLCVCVYTWHQAALMINPHGTSTPSTACFPQGRHTGLTRAPPVFISLNSPFDNRFIGYSFLICCRRRWPDGVCVLCTCDLVW